jgi:hypothetical protein
MRLKYWTLSFSRGTMNSVTRTEQRKDDERIVSRETTRTVDRVRRDGDLKHNELKLATRLST